MKSIKLSTDDRIERQIVIFYKFFKNSKIISNYKVNLTTVPEHAEILDFFKF